MKQSRPLAYQLAQSIEDKDLKNIVGGNGDMSMLSSDKRFHITSPQNVQLDGTLDVKFDN